MLWEASSNKNLDQMSVVVLGDRSLPKSAAVTQLADMIGWRGRVINR